MGMQALHTVEPPKGNRFVPSEMGKGRISHTALNTTVLVKVRLLSYTAKEGLQPPAPLDCERLTSA